MVRWVRVLICFAAFALLCAMVYNPKAWYLSALPMLFPGTELRAH